MERIHKVTIKEPETRERVKLGKGIYLDVVSGGDETFELIETDYCPDLICLCE